MERSEIMSIFPKIKLKFSWSFVCNPDPVYDRIPEEFLKMFRIVDFTFILLLLNRFQKQQGILGNFCSRRLQWNWRNALTLQAQKTPVV